MPNTLRYLTTRPSRCGTVQLRTSEGATDARQAEMLLPIHPFSSVYLKSRVSARSGATPARASWSSPKRLTTDRRAVAARGRIPRAMEAQPGHRRGRRRRSEMANSRARSLLTCGQGRGRPFRLGYNYRPLEPRPSPAGHMDRRPSRSMRFDWPTASAEGRPPEGSSCPWRRHQRCSSAHHFTDGHVRAVKESGAANQDGRRPLGATVTKRDGATNEELQHGQSWRHQEELQSTNED